VWYVFKRILIVLLMVQLLIYGGFSSLALAQTPDETEDLPVENQEQDQTIGVEIVQDQQLVTGDGTDSIVQDQTVTGEEQQHVYDSEESPNNQIKQEQSIEMEAEQTQKATDVEKVEAEQEQDVTIEYSQSLKIEQKDKQSQSTKIVTNQDQSISTNQKTDYVEQVVKAEINTKQVNLADEEANASQTSQDSKVKVSQKHQSETSGQATVQQAQSVEAIADNDQTKGKEVSIKAAVTNGLEVIKEATHFVVKIVQTIKVNDEKIETIEEEIIVEQDKVEKEQKINQIFDWGYLVVLNKVQVNQTEDSDLLSTLESIIEIVFFAQDNDVEDDIPGEENPETPGEEDPPNGENPETPGEEDPPNGETPETPGEGDPPNGENPETPGEEEPPNGENPETPGEEDPPNGENPETPGEEDPPNGENPETPGEEDPPNGETPETPGEGDPPNGETPSKPTPDPDHNESPNHGEKLKDSDRDGIPDDLEIHKFKTNPYQKDTDGDGLSDYFEIVYHSETSYLFTLENMEYDWRHFVPNTVESLNKKIRLNPLVSDTDQNGILDSEEDFDQDGLNNGEEQERKTNPYIK
jgi:hypothetical protein